MKSKDQGNILSHDEVLKILSRQAEEGSVTAAAALERALRARARDEEGELEREFALLTK
jgi:uncharacterized Ntn-hydrolase superfamily protein